MAAIEGSEESRLLPLYRGLRNYAPTWIRADVIARITLAAYAVPVSMAYAVLAGLACKNAVLIVEFAKQNREQGANRFDAAVIASKLRLRPIIMMSFAFILGVVPLMHRIEELRWTELFNMDVVD